MIGNKRAAAAGLIFLLLLGVAGAIASALARYRQMNSVIAQLSAEVEHVRQEQTMPSRVLERYRNSICFIYAVFELPISRDKTIVLRNSGTGFVVADGTVATNHHVLAPEFDDAEARHVIAAGTKPRLKTLVAFFPSVAQPVELTGVRSSKTADLAVAHFKLPENAPLPDPIPLATDQPSAGDPVVVIGYPLGLAGMVAKSPATVYDRLAYRGEGVHVASELAARSLVRPSATYGHLGDVVGSKLIYDAPTAHGGSGGPVLNARGEVIAVNSAFILGFPGGTLGISVSELRPLLR